MEGQEISLKDLFGLLLGKLWIIVSVAFVGAVGAFVWSKFFIAPMYSSHVSMYVMNQDKTPEDQQGVNYTEIATSKALVKTYIEILSDDVVMDAVGDKLIELYGEDEIKSYFSLDSNGKIPDAALRGCFLMEAANETEVLKITATTTNAKLSANLCNIMADIAPEYIIRITGAGAMEKIGEAKVYYGKVSPNVTRYTFLGGVAFGVVAVAVIIIMFMLDNTVKESNDLSVKFEKPIIGEILTIGESKDKDGSAAERNRKLIMTNSEIPFNVVENYKSMRTNLMFALSTYKNKIVAVSSADPSEGKSVTSANMATTLAETENKVLLIDADMRKPVQHKNFRLKNKEGLSTILSGEKSFEECVFRGTKGNLDILTSGVIPPNPSELLASDNMKALLDKVKGMYDYVILDAPPILPVTDVLGLSGSIAGVLIIVRYGRTTYNELEECAKRLELANCNHLGFVLNDISKKHSGSYYYKYRYKYRYKYDYNYKYSYAYGYGYSERAKKAKEAADAED